MTEPNVADNPKKGNGITSWTNLSKDNIFNKSFINGSYTNVCNYFSCISKPVLGMPIVKENLFIYLCLNS